MWPFGKRELHVHIDAAVLRDAHPGDVVLIVIPPEWTADTIRQFQEFVREYKLLPEGVRLCAVPSAHAPLLISAQPKPKTDEDGDDGHK